MKRPAPHKYVTPGYRGDAPFVFVSYSHDDTELVNAELAALTAAGIRVYYDEGIHPGNTWHDELAKALDRCSIGAGITTEPAHPMDDAVKYAPRIRCPMLMIIGSYGAIFPSDPSQRRLFELLGSPESEKKHVVYDVGHFYYPRNQMLREVSDWFDHYLGPVAR